MSRLILIVVLLLGTSHLRAAEEKGADSKTSKKIVLVAGKKRHGPEGNRIHDYPWSARLIKVMLERSNINDQVHVDYTLDGWPADTRLMEAADTIMIISDGRDGDKYSEAPHLDGDQRIAFVEKQVKRGCGLVTFHFSTFGPDKYAEQMFRWTGGYFDWDEVVDGKQKWYSAINTANADVKPATPDHAVLRGVRPFKMNEEFYYNLRFDPNEKAVTPILEVPVLGGRAERGNVVAWTRQREDGGRGFGTSCGHFYDNWKNDDFRKTILNGIAWTAHVELPEKGVEAPYVERDEIQKSLNDFKDEKRDSAGKP